MTRPIARCTHWAPGTARSRSRHCREGADPALHEAGEDEHPSPGGGPKAAHDAALRHRPGGIGRDTCANHPPHMPSRSHHGVTVPPCTPLRCYCRAAAPPDAGTTPKVASAVNVAAHAQSSHSGEGTAQASLDEDDAWKDDFQTSHTPVRHVVWREDDGHGDLAEGRPESSRGSPGWWTEYQVDIGEEEAMLETINPTWRTTSSSWQSRASRMMRCPGMNLSSL